MLWGGILVLEATPFSGSYPGHCHYNLLTFFNGFWQHSVYVNHNKKVSCCSYLKTSQSKKDLMLVKSTMHPSSTQCVEHFALRVL